LRKDVKILLIPLFWQSSTSIEIVVNCPLIWPKEVLQKIGREENVENIVTDKGLLLLLIVLLSTSIVFSTGNVVRSPFSAPLAYASADTGTEELHQKRTLTITAADDKDNALHMWTIIRDASSGKIAFTGFSPIEFAADPSEFYIVSMSNYRTYYFDHWSDGNLRSAPACNCDLPNVGPSIPFRYIPDDGKSYTLSAVYRTTPFPAGQTPLVINAKNIDDGSDLEGMYMMIFREFTYTNPNTGQETKGAVVDATGWTSYFYGMKSDTGYLVEAIDYTTDLTDIHSKALIFDHWAGDDEGKGSSFIKELPAGSPSTTLTIYYKSVPDVCPSCT
jgi:hypothetical protein